ncbi:Ribonucleases P/MRP protein subunit pop1 [Lecanicillium sp. MT-2017a]|nr:Ribonucleases P/MRP protein subunit pop1 [Lecanicillium sp. MT-2017a]
MAPKPAPTGSSGSAPGAKQKTSTGNARSDTFMQKRAKVYAARNIPVQPADAALKDGELDLQAFVAAHEFEIRSLEQSMATSKAVSSTRAFQQVPRGLRRRTASHNAKRVPGRLRARAKKEMKEDNTPTVEARRRKPRTTRARLRAETAKRLRLLAARERKRRMAAKKSADTPDKKKDKGTEETGKIGVVGRKPRPKIRRNMLNDPPLPHARFRKRQIHKTWLPTHLWHAKRARITEPSCPLWRFAMPLTPSEKIYRPTHRAQGERGTVVWDASYMSTIGLYGNPAGITRVLKRIGVTQDSCWNNKGRKWRAGVRSWTGVVSREAGAQRRDMCPCTIVWNPEPATTSEETDSRQLFLRLHPSAFLEVFTELLRLIKMENPRIYIEDLRFEIGSIELTGPASTEALLSTITPHITDINANSKHGELFQSLKGLTNPSVLPANTVLAFSAQDPRLRYPPRRQEDFGDDAQQLKLMETVAEWPAEEQLDSYTIYDRNARHKASCLPSQQAINKRRSAATPGVFLKPTSADPQIPIMLLATRSGSSTQTQGSWTLLLPWKCVVPFWHSIVHCPLISGGNPRFAGLNEAMQVAFERGVPWFPADYVGTDAGAQWELEQRAKRRRDYDRRPKSKRTEWDSLDLGGGRKGEVGDGLACDWEMLFGLRAAEDVSSEAPDADAMEGVEERHQPPKQKQPPLKQLNAISKATLREHTSASLTTQLPPNAITAVRITLLSRGVVTSCARIYRLPNPPASIPTNSLTEVPATMPPSEEATLPHDLRKQWLSRMPSSASTNGKSTPAKQIFQSADLETRKRFLAQELTSAPSPYPSTPHNKDSIGGHHPLVPDAEDLVGFVTSGSFNLADGRGTAMGAVAVEKVLPGIKASPREGRLCIVRNAGENVGWLAKWEAV